MAETSSLRFLVLKEPVNEFIQKQENKNTLSVLREDLKAVENDNLPPSFGYKKMSTIFNEHALITFPWDYVQEDKQRILFSNALQAKERHNGHLRVWPPLPYRIFLITPWLSVILITSWVKLTLSPIASSSIKHYCFILTWYSVRRFCNLHHYQYTFMSFKMKTITSPQSGSNTHCLKRVLKNWCRIRDYRPKTKRRSCHRPYQTSWDSIHL